MSLQRDRRRPTARRFSAPGFETLEPRQLLATVAVNAAQVVRPVNTQLLGVNLAWWDSNLNTTQTQQMVQAAGLTSFRFPGGSSSDDFHFTKPPSYNGQGTDSTMAKFIASVGGRGLVTLDYGSGSPQEAAAFLAYLNAPVSSTTTIGTGKEWNDTTKAWVNVDWKTAGYWAGLRAATPLAKDDGLNFMRLGHAGGFGFHYFEVGNEEYGSWEIDNHGQSGDLGKPHDPATYVTFAKSFATLAAKIDSTISIGIDAGDPYAFNGWVGNVLKQAAAQGFTVGFISDHSYVQGPGSESDSTLLLSTFSNTKSIDDWVVRGADYKTLISQDLGAAGKNVELLATEFNSVYSNPGKQTTSLVNGLSVADSLGVLLTSPYNGAYVWDLRNGWDTSNNNSSNLYGWRKGGDYGLIGSSNGSAPASGSYVPYPTYFAEQLASKIVKTGGNVVQASSSDPNLTTYAVLESNGHLELLVINKSVSGALSGKFQLTGFQPAAQAQVWQYGEAQDTAQSHTTDGHSALANFTTTLSVSGTKFSYSFPAYSMTVLDLGRATLKTAGLERVNPDASGHPSALVTLGETARNAQLLKTWTAYVVRLKAQPLAASHLPVFDEIRE
jgi:alpha-L-arabinofuranosidase